MNKVQLNELTQVVHKEQAFLTALNANFKAIQEAINDTLSRSGVIPNQMEQVLDMNGQRIINVGDPVESTDALTRHFIDGLISDIEEAIERLSTLIEEGKKALMQYAEEHIFPVAQAALDGAIEARDRAETAADDAEEFYNAVKDMHDELSPLAQHLQELLVISNNISDITTVAGLSEAITTISTNIQEILAAPVYAEHAQTWAEGTDEAVAVLGGTHSAKRWAEIAGESASAITGYTVTLLASDWVNSSQTVSLQPVTSTSIVFAAPTEVLENIKAYAAANVFCSEVGNGSLTFSCETVPSVDISVNVGVG